MEQESFNQLITIQDVSTTRLRPLYTKLNNVGVAPFAICVSIYKVGIGLRDHVAMYAVYVCMLYTYIYIGMLYMCIYCMYAVYHIT